MPTAAQYQNALRNAGGDVNNPLFQDWARRFNQGSTAAPTGGMGTTLNYTPSYSYNANPTPRTGQGAFGLVPGPTPMPDPYGDLSRAIPNLGGINASIFGNLESQARGVIPQADVNFARDQAAAAAVGSGMPGLAPGSISGNRLARNLGLMQYQLQQNAAQQYPGLVGAVSGTQTVPPGLQADIASRNAQLAAAPDPRQAQNYAQQLYDQYLRSARGPGGGTGGGGGPAGGETPMEAFPGEADVPYWMNYASQRSSSYTPTGDYSTTLTGNTIGGGGSGDLSDTWYNPANDTSNYGYGIERYWDLGEAPENTSIDPLTGTASYDPYQDLGWG